MTQRCVTEAEASGLPSPLGSAVKLGYSELGQEIAKLGMQLLGRRAHRRRRARDHRGRQVVHDYLWSFQYTIAAGTSQIQRNLIAERILGMPKGRVSVTACGVLDGRRGCSTTGGSSPRRGAAPSSPTWAPT